MQGAGSGVRLLQSLLVLLLSGVLILVLLGAREAGRRQMALAAHHAAERSTRLAALLARAASVPPLALQAGMTAGDGQAFAEAVRGVLLLSDAAGSVAFESERQAPLVIRRTEGPPGTQRADFGMPALRPAGAPVASVESGQLVLAQAAWTAGPSEASHYWGHVTARVPLADLADQLDLAGLAASGFRVGLRFQRDPAAPPLVLHGEEAEDSGGATRVVALPQGSLLSLTVVPASGEPLAAALGAALLAATGLAAFVAWRLGRSQKGAGVESSPPPVEAAVSDKLQREVQARLMAEEHLERSHAMLDSMLEHFPGLVVIKRAADLRITRINRSAELILGRSRDTLIGRSSQEIYAPEFAERLLATDQEALAGGQVVHLPPERLDMPGQPPRWLSYRKLSLGDRDGQPQYVLEFGEDVTERERLYQEMREHLHFVEQLLEAMPGPLFYKDAEGRYLGANGAFERFIGRSRAQLVGRTVYDISPPELAAVYDQADRDLLASGGTQIYESRVTRADGSIADVMFHKAVFRSTGGEQGGIVGFALDISQRKLAERRVAQLNRILTVLGATSQLIIETRDRDRLVGETARLLCEKGGFPVAWVSLEDTGAPWVWGPPGAPTTVARLLEVVARPEGRPCWPRTRLSCRRPGCCDQELMTVLADAGFHSMIHLPLEYLGAVRGNVGILGGEEDLFDGDEDRLLAELATNIGHALEALHQEQARRAAEEKLQLAGRVFENNAEGIIVTDADNRIVMVNKAFTLVTGFEAEEVVGRNPSMLSSGRQDPEFYRQMWRTLRQRGEWRGEIVNRRKNGEYFPEWLTISMVRSDAGEVTNYVAVFSDLTARKQVEERLDFLAHYDALTALPNRILFTDRLDRALVQAARAGQKVALLFLDLDRFKLINETIGHSAGDELLRTVSDRLRAAAGTDDSVSRMGGDHFAVFASGLATADEAAGYARRLQKALEQPLFAGREIHVSASIGISLFPDDGEDSETLAMNADSAMYQAIADGGNTVRFFRQDMNRENSVRVQIEGRLHRALERGELKVFYQPFVSAATRRVVGGEALLRWENPELDGFVSPSVFIPLLEETGLIMPVGEWVLGCALDEVARWRALAGDTLVVAVNVSAVQLADDELPRKVATMLAERELDPGCLEIELTESAVMRDPQRGIRLLREFKILGIQISMDDFGTGYSSLSYLKQLPIGVLKIDRSFVMDTPGDGEAVTIVRAIIAMGHSLGLHVIAEGVESQAQADFLGEAGADILQGYFCSAAVPAEDFYHRLQAQHALVDKPGRPAGLRALAGSGDRRRERAKRR
jgi:diguanylate cyclase (GGDEF)-like protein/PAS domain S-box-containing protein